MTPQKQFGSAIAPHVHELRPAPAAEDVFRALRRLPHCLFLDSAQRHPTRGRYSYVAADPFAFCRFTDTTADPWREFEAQLDSLTGRTEAELPSFQGGAAGLFAYDLNRSLEVLPAPRCDDFHVPALAVGIYDVVIAFDHQTERAWIISQGWPEQSAAGRSRRAAARLVQFRERIARHRQPEHRSSWPDDEPTMPRRASSRDAGPQNLRVSTHAGLLSNFTAEAFQTAVQCAIEHIRAGDIFQVNLAQRLLYPADCSAYTLYQRLRKANPAPFAGYFDLGSHQIISASPERFLRVQQGQVETRPIKGTRPRRQRAEADLFAGDDLRRSEKDLAENVMIVDLMRNDLSRVCEPDSVIVTQLCELETYEYVQHLVSAVVGKLATGNTSLDLLRATFPGGSITGAPKIRAMEIIADIEPHARGAYCGSLGYLSWDGAMDLSILIRTITAADGWWQFPVGGGIVAQSDPCREYEETWHKAEGLLRAILP